MEIVFEHYIDNRRLIAIEHRHLFGNDIKFDDLMVLRKQNPIREPNVTGTYNGDFHDLTDSSIELPT